MADIQLSGIGVTAARGKLGNSVFTANRSGNIVREYVVPFNSTTAPRQQTKLWMSTCDSLWAGITPTQAELWTFAASRIWHKNKVGHKFHPTGRNLFIGCNYNLLCSGNMPVDTPNMHAITPPIYSLTIPTPAASTIFIVPIQTNGSAFVPADCVLVVSFSPPVSAGINYPRNNFRIVQVLPEFTLVDAYDFTADYIAMFGAYPPSGSKFFARVWNLNVLSGLKSTPLTASRVA